METTVKTSKKVISDKSAQAQKLIANAKAAETIAQINATIEEVPVENEDQIIKEIGDAESTLQLKSIAQKYPVFEKLVPDLKNYKSFSTVYELMMDCVEPTIKRVKKPKAPKVPKVPVPSAYGTAVEIMCKNPALTFPELKSQLANSGFTKDSACRTAHVTVHKIFNLLQTNGFVK